MTRTAWIYIIGTLTLGAICAVLAFVVAPVALPMPDTMWLLFGGLTLLATLSQLFQVEVPGRQNYYPHTAFFFAGVLLLPPPLFVLVVAIPHLIEWAKERILRGPHLRQWYIQPFNIATHIISGMVAYAAYTAFGTPLSTYTLQSVLGATAAATVYVVANHLLVGAALVTARGISWRGSGVFSMDSILPDAIMAYCGYIVAVLLHLSPWMALPALSPLALVHRLFVMLRLKQDNLTDGKTGLWNKRHLDTVLEAELERAKRFNRYMSILSVNLDLHVQLKNDYGKLALDTVLAAIGRVFRMSIRQYDVAAYMDGEKFVLLMPETNPFESLVVAERIRTAIEGAKLPIETSDDPISVTVSIGISCFPGDGVTGPEMLRAASDTAAYALQKGGNRTICFADMPPAPTPAETATGSLQLKGEIYAHTEKEVGFANPTLRNSASR